jgi:PTH1 family peptidyl-tRNA hydrolase
LKLIVGLGNPGSQYEETRHNIGYRFLQYLLDNEYQSETSFNSVGKISNKFVYAGVDIRTFRSSSYMNDSGIAIQQASAYYKIDPKDIFVIHDEIDLEFGRLKHKLGGGDNGHNGLKSITKQLGTPNYNRIRIGVGRPSNPHIVVADFVLGKFTQSETKEIPDILLRTDQLLSNVIS